MSRAPLSAKSCCALKETECRSRLEEFLDDQVLLEGLKGSPLPALQMIVFIVSLINNGQARCCFVRDDLKVFWKNYSSSTMCSHIAKIDNTLQKRLEPKRLRKAQEIQRAESYYLHSFRRQGSQKHFLLVDDDLVERIRDNLKLDDLVYAISHEELLIKLQVAQKVEKHLFLGDETFVPIEGLIEAVNHIYLNNRMILKLSLGELHQILESNQVSYAPNLETKVAVTLGDQTVYLWDSKDELFHLDSRSLNLDTSKAKKRKIKHHLQLSLLQAELIGREERCEAILRTKVAYNSREETYKLLKMLALEAKREILTVDPIVPHSWLEQECVGYLQAQIESSENVSIRRLHIYRTEELGDLTAEYDKYIASMNPEKFELWFLDEKDLYRDSKLEALAVFDDLCAVKHEVTEPMRSRSLDGIKATGIATEIEKVREQIERLLKLAKRKGQNRTVFCRKLASTAHSTSKFYETYIMKTRGYVKEVARATKTIKVTHFSKQVPSGDYVNALLERISDSHKVQLVRYLPQGIDRESASYSWLKEFDGKTGYCEYELEGYLPFDLLIVDEKVVILTLPRNINKPEYDYAIKMDDHEAAWKFSKAIENCQASASNLPFGGNETSAAIIPDIWSTGEARRVLSTPGKIIIVNTWLYNGDRVQNYLREAFENETHETTVEFTFLDPQCDAVELRRTQLNGVDVEARIWQSIETLALLYSQLKKDNVKNLDERFKLFFQDQIPSFAITANEDEILLGFFLPRRMATDEPHIKVHRRNTKFDSFIRGYYGELDGKRVLNDSLIKFFQSGNRELEFLPEPTSASREPIEYPVKVPQSEA